MCAALLCALIGSAFPTSAAAQFAVSPPLNRQESLTNLEDAKGHEWKRFALGFGASILAHESAHVLSALLMGYHPYYAFDSGRPTVYSGIDSDKDPHQQFIFSASGLTTQALINEGILDIPHDGGGPIERGLLAGGIGTTLFYITLGRNASVSDITYMARTSSLSKTQVSLIFGGVSAIQALRISRDPKYDHFFVRPAGDGLQVGMSY
ncbi:MAG: hypothetical protein ACJ8AF_00625 [Gemmatimonadaceae bacterium]